MKKVFYILCSLLFGSSMLIAKQVVQIKSGKVAGIATPDGQVVSYKGIPFAAPPVGDLRWKAPQPVKPWEGVKECTAFGPSPMQGKPAPFSMWSQEFLIPEEPISENCLYLNVWTGAKSPKEKRSVLVWIYGGGFQSGGSGVPIYDGEAMARKGIVFVSINYRVGVFGFLAHPELTKESPNSASGNYGLMDQVAALKWVKENIAAFGGDPDNVTIAGQSAGSMSVNCMVATPLAKGLFNKAIAESGASFGRNQQALAPSEEAGVAFAKSLGATGLADLRKLSPQELMKGQLGIRGPIIDGFVLPQHIADIFAEGKENPVDLLTGWNQDEGLLFGPVKNATDFETQINQQYGSNAGKVLTYYPASDDAEAAQSQLDLSRDMIFGLQNYAWANVQAKQGRTSVYVYRFTRKVPGTGEYAKYGAFHTGEVPYAYDNLEFVDRPWEAVDRKLEATMSTYWANFVKTGNPNATGLPEWPIYKPDSQQVMLLGTKAEAKPIADGEALDTMTAILSANK
ncbi:carboxylesterase family protein [uncultured Imperialibacter sp.]|uniref:carboxylesterase/lipase family protein n=1 Tax=uncultured Imperialibacter sp. TaxID=1672639 RepID=UPI0030D85C4D|tara:strand:- start:10427 stop:11962 length:1536 start_codon:yes stop_codon:yes gene_type:complete